ncbi:MAG: DUF3300 domain-containing protein, partial [Chromatiaceae bacterium]|nr:DUF3300 domain-containing protein [Chromatiaceae bacterium]
MQWLKHATLSCLIALWLVHGVFVSAQQQTQQAVHQGQGLPGHGLFPPDQIEQLVAPIALYPDALLAQILMAATYPLDIVQAARWRRAKGDLRGEALEKAVEEQAWDPSVKSLVFFPSVLEFMNDNLDWTQDLGDAMLAQKDELMDAVQRLRRQAQDAGALQTTAQQRVETEG